MTTNLGLQRQIKVFIVDDHPLTAFGLQGAAQDLPWCCIVGDAPGPDGVVESVKILEPDVVILDIRLGHGANGFDVARELKTQFPDLKILMLSAFDQEPYAQESRRIGVNGYMLKSTHPTAVLNAVRTIADGGMAFAPEIMNRLIRPSELSALNGVLFSDDLTAREAEVLQLVADGLSNQEIAHHLSVSRSAVDVHLKYAYTKLGVHNRTGAVIRAMHLGLIVIEEEVHGGP